MEMLFVIFALLMLYPYVIFPALVTLWSRLAGKKWEQRAITLPITLVISVHNEEKVLPEKLSNSLMLDYPKHMLEIMLVSDGSTDRTNAIISSCSQNDERVVLEAYPERKGKTACLNLSVPKAKGEIIVFTDANSMFPRDMLRKIVRNFSDQSVGLVTGWTKYRRGNGEEGTTGIYARLEMLIKKGESLLSSCVGADGAVFAMRKTLYCPLKDYDINDFVIPLNVIGAGKRVVLDPEVYCLEQPSEGKVREYRRQARITNRTLGAISRNMRYLNPFVYGSFSFFLLSHKIIRFLVPFFFIATFVTLLFLSSKSFVYALFALLQTLCIGIGISAMASSAGGSLAHFMAFILLTFLAQVTGWLRWATGRTDVIWKPER